MGHLLGAEKPSAAGPSREPATAAGQAVPATGPAPSCRASRDDGRCLTRPSGGPLSRTRAISVLACLGVAALAGLMLLVPPIRQPEAYHAFHDARPLLGIANFWNVASNLPFLVIGLLGLRWLAARPTNLAPELRPAYAVVFAGLGFTALGSVYYHWAPTTATLFWDRLPIAVSFMALYAALLTERTSLRWAPALLCPFALFGAAGAIFWHLTGDLRLYAFAQFFPVLTIPLILWLFPAAYTRGADLMAGVGFYAVAKLCEDMDGAIYHGLGELISGHTLKHLAAALGAFWIYRMLRLRARIV